MKMRSTDTQGGVCLPTFMDAPCEMHGGFELEQLRVPVEIDGFKRRDERIVIDEEDPVVVFPRFLDVIAASMRA